MAIITIKEGYEVKPAGMYVLRVKDVQVKTAQKGANAGNSFLAWEDEVLEADDSSLIGESYSHITPPGCSPKSKHYKLFDSLGFGIPEGEKEMKFDHVNLIGREFVAEVIVTKDGDNEKNEFKNIWSPEEFHAHLQKTAALSSKLVSSATTVIPKTITKTVTVPEQPKKASILQGSKLSDFPQ